MSWVYVAGLFRPDVKVEIEAIVAVEWSTEQLVRIAVGSDPKAAPTHPASIWPFSAGDGAHPAVRHAGILK